MANQGRTGVHDFLGSCRIALPEREPGDSPEAVTVYGLGNRKNEDVTCRIARDGVEVFPGSLRYLQAATRAGSRRIVVSSSANTALVLRIAGLDQYVEGRTDAVNEVRAIHASNA